MTKDGEVTLYDYNINDQLTIETAPEGITSYEYDNNGNTIRKTSPDGITDYSYNYNNRLITADAGGDVTSYVYSADGNRVSKTDAYGTTNYLVDTNNSTGYAQVLEELDSNNNCMVYYTYGDDLISQTRGSLTNYYHYDGHGSVRALTNAPEMVTDTYTYDAFGNEIASTGDTPNNYKYCGEQYDPNVGFYYLRARYYNPSVGRFTTTDPYQGSIYDPPSLHKYLYCHGNPVDNIDPSGMMTLLEVQVSIFLVVLLAAFVLPGLIDSKARAKQGVALAKLLALLGAIIASKTQDLCDAIPKTISRTKKRREIQLVHFTNKERGAAIVSQMKINPSEDGYVYLASPVYLAFNKTKVENLLWGKYDMVHRANYFVLIDVTDLFETGKIDAGPILVPGTDILTGGMEFRHLGPLDIVNRYRLSGEFPDTDGLTGY
ncbi:MAG: RHS repeat-associated core domain-containing protein [Candidatus Auribacterota bacterium]|nr:RHS repeat-associated core domain-containing protein [Candidatus Auribacterota bacterium]